MLVLGGVGIKGLWGRDERVYGWRWDIWVAVQLLPLGLKVVR